VTALLHLCLLWGYICVRYTRGGQGFTLQVFEGGGSRFFSLSPRLSLCAMGMDGGIEDETRVCKRKNLYKMVCLPLVSASL
jgi:hypothetical protein